MKTSTAALVAVPALLSAMANSAQTETRYISAPGETLEAAPLRGYRSTTGRQVVDWQESDSDSSKLAKPADKDICVGRHTRGSPRRAQLRPGRDRTVGRPGINGPGRLGHLDPPGDNGRSHMRVPHGEWNPDDTDSGSGSDSDSDAEDTAEHSPRRSTVSRSAGPKHTASPRHHRSIRPRSGGEDGADITTGYDTGTGEDCDPSPGHTPPKRMALGKRFADLSSSTDLYPAFTAQAPASDWPYLSDGYVQPTLTTTDTIHIFQKDPTAGFGGLGEPPLITLPPVVVKKLKYTTHWPDDINSLWENTSGGPASAIPASIMPASVVPAFVVPQEVVDRTDGRGTPARQKHTSAAGINWSRGAVTVTTGVATGLAMVFVVPL